MHFTHHKAEAADKDVEFLAFRQLNKRARVRLSALPFTPEHLSTNVRLFAVANTKGWFASVTQVSTSNFAVVFAPLSDLRTAFLSANHDDEIPFIPKRVLNTTGTPTMITFTTDNSRMLMSLKDGQILVYETSRLFTTGLENVSPMHSWPPSPHVPRQILPNPGDMPNLIAILFEPDAPQSVVVLDVQRYETFASWARKERKENIWDPITSISWSPKGKQLAIGLKSGTVTTFMPAEPSVPKLNVPPSSVPTPRNLISLNWLTNDTFYTIYASSSPDLDHTHIVVTMDSKSGVLEEVKFVTPYFLLPGIISNEFLLTIKNWEPVKLMLIIGVSASSDIGIIGNIDDGWCNLSLEETVTPKIPLDSNGNETMLVALELDLTNDLAMEVNTGGDGKGIPPGPILYSFANDGTVQGWYVINTNAAEYPGMVQISSATSLGSSPPNVAMEPHKIASPVTTNQSPVSGAASIRSPVFNQTSVKASALDDLSSLDLQSQPMSISEGKGETSTNRLAPPIPGFGQTSSLQSSFTLPSTSAFTNSGTAQANPSQTSPSPFGQSGFQSLSAFTQSGDKPTNVFGQSGFTTKPSSLLSAQSTIGGFATYAKGGMMSFTGTGATTGDNKEPVKSSFGGGDTVIAKTPSNLIKPGFLGTGFSSSAFSPPSGDAKSAFSSFAVAANNVQPFANTTAAIQPPSVFGSTSVLAGPKPGLGASSVPRTSDPVFGTSSMMGKPLDSQSLLTRNTGFGSFSSSSSGFGAIANVQKSFKELLREKSLDALEPQSSSIRKTDDAENTKPTTPIFASADTSTISQCNKREMPSANAKGPFSLPVKVDIPVSKAKSTTESMTTSQTSPKMAQGKSNVQTELSTSNPSIQSLSDTLSFSSLDSSFVDVLETKSTEKSFETEGFEDDTHSSPETLSEQFEGPEDGDSADEDDQASPPATPEQTVKILLPITPDSFSRSLSTTPKPEISAARALSSSPPSTSPSVVETATAISRSPSPGVKPFTSAIPLASPSGPPVAIPVPVTITPTASSNAIGLGRPSSRPSRSSPLAAAPLSVHGTDQKDIKSTIVLPGPKPQPASPKTPFGQWGSPSESGQSESLKPSRSIPERTHSPPLFSTFLRTPSQGSPKSAPSVALSLNSSPATPSPPLQPGLKPPTRPLTVNSLFKVGSDTRNESPRPDALYQGMQAECVHLFSGLAKDLENLKLLAQKAREKREEISWAVDFPSRTVDRCYKAKWKLHDIHQFGEILKQNQGDLCQLKSLRVEHYSSLRILRGQMLKAGTRKEEVVRFDRAKTDTEFADILRVRTLGPEHRETQNQLRKDVRVMRDRIQKLEDHLYASKKRLEQHKSGKPSFITPSLDTINRTYRNIDVAISQQAQDVANVTSRMMKLNLNTALHTSTTRDERLPDIVSRRPFNITPNVAITTAAALNAERSAQKLKRALLDARKKPYLNTKASAEPVAIDTPLLAMPQNVTKSTQLLGAHPLGMVSPKSRWDHLELSFDEPSSIPSTLPTRRTTGTGVKHHSKPITLRRGGTSRNSPPAPSFDWGPLPSITPMTTIAADVRRKDEGTGDSS